MTRPGGDVRGVLHQVFGAELPQESTDESDRDNRDNREQWLRENVPPHHI